jgi:hypothetical protein
MTSLINAGQRVTADLLDELIPLSAVKSGDQHYTNTTFAADSELFIDVDANATYLVVSSLFYEGGTLASSDIKIEWTIPSGSNLYLAVPAVYQTDGTTHGPAALAASVSFVMGTQGVGVVRSLTMTGSLTTGGTPGVIQLMAAKNSSGSTDAIIHAQSTLALQQVG